MKIRLIICLIALSAALPSVPARAEGETPKAERPVWPPPGSTLTMRIKVSGSLGSGTQEATATWLGEVDWEGRRVMGIARGGTHFYQDKERRPLAQVRDGKPILTFHPYEANYDWPLFVGKSWTSEAQVTNHDRNQTFEEKLVYTVEAFEEITVPAGTFKTFRIQFVTPEQREVRWYEPKLGMEIKRDWERYATHRSGVGTLQIEAISYAIKK